MDGIRSRDDRYRQDRVPRRSEGRREPEDGRFDEPEPSFPRRRDDASPTRRGRSAERRTTPQTPPEGMEAFLGEILNKLSLNKDDSGLPPAISKPFRLVAKNEELINLVFQIAAFARTNKDLQKLDKKNPADAQEYVVKYMLRERHAVRAIEEAASRFFDKRTDRAKFDKAKEGIKKVIAMLAMRHLKEVIKPDPLTGEYNKPGIFKTVGYVTGMLGHEKIMHTAFAGAECLEAMEEFSESHEKTTVEKFLPLAKAAAVAGYHGLSVGYEFWQERREQESSGLKTDKSRR